MGNEREVQPLHENKSCLVGKETFLTLVQTMFESEVSGHPYDLMRFKVSLKSLEISANNEDSHSLIMHALDHAGNDEFMFYLAAQLFKPRFVRFTENTDLGGRVTILSSENGIRFETSTGAERININPILYGGTWPDVNVQPQIKSVITIDRPKVTNLFKRLGKDHDIIRSKYRLAIIMNNERRGIKFGFRRNRYNPDSNDLMLVTHGGEVKTEIFGVTKTKMDAPFKMSASHFFRVVEFLQSEDMINLNILHDGKVSVSSSDGNFLHIFKQLPVNIE